MSETTDFWAGDFGNEYNRRCRVDWRARIPFWDRIVQMTGIRSAFEVGCNAGWNLSAIKHTNHGYNVCVYGCDVNAQAVDQATIAGLEVFHGPLIEKQVPCELAFTAGMLIHVVPEHIVSTMQSIIDASSDYVLAIEYDAEVETEVEYRGHSGKLWKRNYGDLYQKLGLDLIETGLVDKNDGFDNCRYWLLRKPCLLKKD